MNRNALMCHTAIGIESDLYLFNKHMYLLK